MSKEFDDDVQKALLDEIPEKFKKPIVETPAQFDAGKERYRTEYGKLFSSEEQFELFCMLPVKDEDRPALVSVMAVEKKTQKRGAKRTQLERPPVDSRGDEVIIHSGDVA